MRKDLSLVYSMFGKFFNQDGLREEFSVCDQTLLLLIRNLEWLSRCQSRILLHPKLNGVVPEIIAVQSKVTISLNGVLFRDRLIVDVCDLHYVVIHGLVAYYVFLAQREHLPHLFEYDTIIGAFGILQSIPRSLL
jgi:hypothetical protein